MSSDRKWAYFVLIVGILCLFFWGLPWFGIAFIAFAIWQLNGTKTPSRKDDQNQRTTAGTAAQTNSNTGSTRISPSGKKTQIIGKPRYPTTKQSQEVITSCCNGVVYYADTDSIMGRYDPDGRVYNKEGKFIGFSYETEIVMSREYNYKWLQEHLSGLTNSDPVMDPDCKPAMTMLAGENYCTIIEAPLGLPSVHIDGSDFIGAGAAYLVAINDGLLHEALESFYKDDGIQDEIYYLARNRNRNSMEYYEYFKNKWGHPWYSLN